MDVLLPVIRLASSRRVSFPCGSRTRRVLCHKVIDILYIIGVRIGFEYTRQIMAPLLQRFFASFDRVYGSRPRSSSDLPDKVIPKGEWWDVLSVCLFLPLLEHELFVFWNAELFVWWNAELFNCLTAELFVTLNAKTLRLLERWTDKLLERWTVRFFELYIVHAQVSAMD